MFLFRSGFDQLLASCRDPNSFKRNEGLKILSGGLSSERPLYANELLTEKHLPGYTSLVAGIKNTQPRLQKILGTLQLESTEDAFFDKIERIKSEFREIGRKYLLDWVPGQISEVGIETRIPLHPRISIKAVWIWWISASESPACTGISK